MTTSKLSLRQDEQLFARVLEDLAAWARAARVAGPDLRPYAGASGPERFRELGEDRRRDVLRRVEVFLDVCRRGSTDRVLFWHMLSALGLRPRADFLSHVELGDVIQIHDAELVQLFCSPSFLGATGHALDDLFCRPFLELYRRDARKTQLFLAAAFDALDGRTGGTARVGGGIHPVVGTDVDHPVRSLVEVKVLAPLADEKGKVVALATTLHCFALSRPFSSR